MTYGCPKKMYLISIANNLFSFCRTIMKQVSIERSNLKVLFGMLNQLLKHLSMGLSAPSFARHKSAGCPLQEIFSHELIEFWISYFNSVMLSGRPSQISCYIQSLMKKFSGLRSGEHCSQIQSDILTSVFLVSDLPAIHEMWAGAPSCIKMLLLLASSAYCG